MCFAFILTAASAYDVRIIVYDDEICGKMKNNVGKKVMFDMTAKNSTSGCGGSVCFSKKYDRYFDVGWLSVAFSCKCDSHHDTMAVQYYSYDDCMGKKAYGMDQRTTSIDEFQQMMNGTCMAGPNQEYDWYWKWRYWKNDVQGNYPPGLPYCLLPATTTTTTTASPQKVVADGTVRVVSQSLGSLAAVLMTIWAMQTA